MKVVNLTTPVFKNETEEADWWFEHRNYVEDELGDAIERGDRPAIAFELQPRPILPLAAEDAALASEQARRKGLSFEEYATRLFHEAVLAEETRKAS